MEHALNKGDADTLTEACQKFFDIYAKGCESEVYSSILTDSEGKPVQLVAGGKRLPGVREHMLIEELVNNSGIDTRSSVDFLYVLHESLKAEKAPDFSPHLQAQ